MPSSESLKPTLWRTARALANRTRLQVLEHLLKHPDGLTVSEIAEEFHLSMPVASLYLRALNARGLLAAGRRGRWVVYRASADRTLPDAARLLQALEQTFLVERRSTEYVYHVVTAFTHPRRAAIVRALEKKELALLALSRKTGIPSPALWRHLSKLVDRKFVARRRRVYQCALPAGALGKTLHDLALCDS